MNLTGRPPLGLKQPKPERGTAAARAHIARVKALPCIVCGTPGPSDAHHVFHGRFGSRRASDFDTIPLCKPCHQGPGGVHDEKAGWAARHGFDFDFLPLVAAQLGRGDA